MAKQWTPPDYARTPDSFQPRRPTAEEELEAEFNKPEVEEPSYLGRFWDYINTPIVTAPSEIAREAADYIDSPSLERSPTRARIEGFGAGALEGLGDFISSLTTPANVGLSILSGGSVGAASAAARTSNIANKQALQRIAQALEAPGRAAGVGMVGHGGYTAVTGDTLQERAAGLTEAALGALGARRLSPDVTKIDVLDAPPVDRPMFPLPRGRSEVIEHEPFISGPKGVIENKGMVRSELGEMTPEAAVNYGTAITNKANQPFVTVGDEAPGLQLIAGRILANRDGSFTDIETGKTVGPTGLDPNLNQGMGDAELAGTTPYPQAAEAPIVTTPDKPVSFSEIEDPSIQFSKQEWQPPDYALQPEPEMQGMRVPDSTNIAMGGASPRVLQVLGSSLYGNARPTIVAKELLQNSFDEHRIIGNSEPIKVVTDSNSKHPKTGARTNSITVRDFGRGLTPDELYTKFTDVGVTGKADEESASGGFGFAKAAPMLSGNYAIVESVVEEKGKKWLYRFEGDPNQLIDQGRGVPLTKEKVPQETATGMRVTTHFPEDENIYGAERFVEAMVAGSPSVTSDVELASTYGAGERELRLFLDGRPTEGMFDIKTIRRQSAPPLQDTLEIPGAKINIHYNPPPQHSGERNMYNLHVLNKGLYQSSNQSYYGTKQIPDVPADITADIVAIVEEGHKDYPFTANRETLPQKIKDAIYEYTENKFVKPAQGKQLQELVTIYNGMVEIPIKSGTGKRKFFLYDEGKRLTPNETAAIIANPNVQAMSGIISDITHKLLGAVGLQSWSDELERVGLMMYETPGVSVHEGLWVPKPGERGKATILINPLGIMSRNDPIASAIGITHTIVHELAHSLGVGHGERHTQEIARIMKSPGTRSILYNGEDEIIKAVSRRDGLGYTLDIEELLRVYTNSRGRPATISDTLSGTGVKSENRRPDRKKQVPLNARPNTVRASAGPVAKLSSALQQGILARGQQDVLASQERGRRIGAADKVKTPGMAGYQQQLGMLSGALPKVPVEAQLSPEDVDALLDAITNSDLRPFQKINAKSGVVKLLAGEAPQPSEIKFIGQVFGPELENIIMLHGGLGFAGVRDFVNNTVNLPKSLMATMDVSAPLRQGLPFITRPEYWTAFKDMFKYYGSERAFQDNQTALMERPNFELGEESGLFLAGIGQDLERREEQFLSQYAERIPVLGKFVRASERAYVGFLNQLRANVFDNLIDEAFMIGAKPEIARPLARFVNTASGRGSLGRFEKNALELNALLFSPRLIASRLTMLNPAYYISAEPFVRKQALKALLSVAAAGMTFAALSKLAGADVSENPTSSDFGKVKIGNTRLDPYGGFQQYVVAASRLISGRTTSTTGREYKLGGKFPAPTRLGVAAQFGESKLSPVASFIDVMLKGDQAFPPKGLGAYAQPKSRFNAEVINRFTPMITNDLMEVYQDDPDLLPLGILAALGMSMQTFEPRPGASPFNLGVGGINPPSIEGGIE